MFNKFELLGISISIISMVLALYLLNLQSAGFASTPTNSQLAQSAVVVGDSNNQEQDLRNALLDGTNNKGIVEKLIIDDVLVGNGAEAKTGKGRIVADPTAQPRVVTMRRSPVADRHRSMPGAQAFL